MKELNEKLVKNCGQRVLSDCKTCFAVNIVKQDFLILLDFCD